MYVVVLCLLNAFLSWNAYAHIHGEDTRIVVHEDTWDYFYADRVGRLVAYNEDSGETKSCSATQISEEFIMTAASCVIDIKQALAYSNIHYFPAFRGHSKKSPSRVFVDNVFIPKAFIHGALTSRISSLSNSVEIKMDQLKNNIALIPIFSERHQKYVGTSHGYLGLWRPDWEQLSVYSKFSMELYTYPNDKKQAGYELGNLWYESCYSQQKFGNLATTSCDTAEGSEGAGVYQYSEVHETPFIVGVYSGELENENIVTWLTNDMFRAVRKILDRKFDQQDYFDEVPIYSERAYYVYAYNECPMDLDLHVRMKTKAHNWWNNHHLPNLNPGRRTFVSKTDEPFLVYRMVNNQDANSFSLLVDEPIGMFIERNLNNPYFEGQIRRDTFGKSLYGDHYINLNCLDSIKF